MYTVRSLIPLNNTQSRLGRLEYRKGEKSESRKTLRAKPHRVQRGADY